MSDAARSSPKIPACPWAQAYPFSTSASTVDNMKRPRKLKPEAIAEIFLRFQQTNPEPKGNSFQAIPLPSSLPWCFRRRLPMPVSTGPRRRSLKLPILQKRWWRSGKRSFRKRSNPWSIYRTKAKNIIALSKALIARHGSAVPQTREALEALPGVGRKTANVVMNSVFGAPTIAVDTHLFRVSNRTGLAPGRVPLEVEMGLQKAVPEQFKTHAHHWLILHGRYICKARRPECWRCPICDICRYPDKTPSPAQ